MMPSEPLVGSDAAPLTVGWSKLCFNYRSSFLRGRSCPQRPNNPHLYTAWS